MRFLKCRYILVKENDATSPTTFSELNYKPPHFDTYEIENYHGYNNGDAKFLNLVKGHYILKIKPEAYGKTSQFVVNYASNLPIRMSEYFPDKKQTSLMLREAMASLIGPMANIHKDVDRTQEEIVFANSFENIGYGFVGVRLNKTCPHSVLMEFDPTYSFILSVVRSEIQGTSSRTSSRILISLSPLLFDLARARQLCLRKSTE